MTIMHKPLKGERCFGFTLLEMLIVAVLTLSMVYVVTTLSISGSDAQKYAERMGRATEVTQDLSGEIRRELNSSVRLLTNDALGSAYRGLLKMSAMPTPIAGRLPRLDPTAIFDRELAAAPRTGNELFFAKHAWTDEFLCTSGARYRVDVYRIILYYMAAAGGGPQPGTPYGLNLCKFTSEPFADGGQIDEITVGADQQEVLLHLLNQTPDTGGRVHGRVEVVCLLGDDPGAVGTLRQILPSGLLSATTAAPRDGSWNLVPDLARSSTSLLDVKHHSIATNHARSSFGVGRFSVVSMTGDGFPHGFETQVIGPSGARQVLLCLAIVSTNRQGHTAHALQQTVVDARDL
jgi:hypothetical protein